LGFSLLFFGLRNILMTWGCLRSAPEACGFGATVDMTGALYVPAAYQYPNSSLLLFTPPKKIPAWRVNRNPVRNRIWIPALPNSAPVMSTVASVFLRCGVETSSCSWIHPKQRLLSLRLRSIFINWNCSCFF